MLETRCARGSLLLALVIALVPARASAYIDPGSGSFLLQMLLAGLLGLSMAIKLYWRRLKKVIGRLFSSRQERPTAEK